MQYGRAYRILGIAVAVAVVSASSVRAQGTLDQSQTGVLNLGADLNNAFAEMGQTYTAGLTGALIGVNVDIGSFTDAPINLSVYSVQGGALEATPLGFVSFVGDKRLDDFVAFASFIPQIAGNQYALVATVPGQPLDSSGYGIWAGTSADVYTGGYLFGGLNGAGVPTMIYADADLHFRTYVNTGGTVAPEAPSGLLWMTGALAGGFWRRLRGRSL